MLKHISQTSIEVGQKGKVSVCVCVDTEKEEKTKDTTCVFPTFVREGKGQNSVLYCHCMVK